MSVWDSFHLIRPWALICLPLIAVLWWQIRPNPEKDQPVLQALPEHLAKALTVGGASRRRLYPIDGVALVLALLTLAVSGPTWSKLPNPLQTETAPLVIALEVTPSMTETDIAPSRLERAKFKIRDLVARRTGAETALIAYAGSAHRVVPLTTDPAVLASFLDGLSPAVMPREGDDPAAALAAAETELARADTAGAIVMLLDDVPPDAVAALGTSDGPPRVLLVMAPNDVALPQLSALNGAEVVRTTAGDQDLDAVQGAVLSAYRAAQIEDDTQIWDDKGVWLAWPAALLLLLWFRRGWTMRWGALAALAVSLSAPGTARAEGVADWFWTPDQQARRAYEANDFERAAGLFEDPMWRALSEFRAGQYEAAAETYAGLDSAEAAYGEGLARLRNREYRAGVRAFERALELQPDYPDAAHNLAVAQAMVTLVESQQAQSDTGEERGIGADDIVEDNESGLGTQTQVMPETEGEGLQSAEQWMRSVETDVSDFLATRFKLEVAETPE